MKEPAEAGYLDINGTDLANASLVSHFGSYSNSDPCQTRVSYLLVV